MMPQRRMLTAFAFCALFTAGLAAGTAQAGDEEPKPCSAKDFKYAKVKAACEKGGQKEAKKLMKAAVKKMKADGKDVNCKSCHNDLKKYDLKDNANADLKGYL